MGLCVLLFWAVFDEVAFIGGPQRGTGQCAQPCRMPYNLVNEKRESVFLKRLFVKPKDLNMIEYLPLLIEAGMIHLKLRADLKGLNMLHSSLLYIEKAIDRFIENPEKYSVTSDEKRQLAKMFNRGFYYWLLF